MQHYAPYFMDEVAPYFKRACATSRVVEYSAQTFYGMGMGLIANSTWLKHRVERLTGIANIAVCPNAIRHEHFYADRGARTASSTNAEQRVTVISYGGRGAKWKGFREMAQAVAQVREEVPNVSLLWKVYGGALIPSTNDVAEYEDLGYLSQRRLADAYRTSDVLLSASWYESFPLFPLEAMACEVATITTAPGTEDYARHGETAHIVYPRDVRSIAAGLRRLVEDFSYRRRLGTQGAAEARKFTWDRAVARMESLLLASAKN